MTRQDDILSFLDEASRRPVYVPVEEPAPPPAEEPTQEQEEEIREAEELTPDERIEYLQYAMRNLGLVADAAQETVVEIPQPEPEPEPEPDPMEGVPENERPLDIPTYSSIREELVRFSDAEWFNKVQEKVVILAGVGGIGSNMAVILAKLNPKAIYMFDDDIVDSYNLAGQFYSKDDIGKPKVEALAASVAKYTNYTSIFAMNRRYDYNEEIVGDIMICGFDNMNARKTFYEHWKKHVYDYESVEDRKNCLFIDGRLTADEFQIFSIVGNDEYYMDEYERKYLFKDYEVANERCSYKQTGYMAEMIGAFMVNLLVNFCANQVNPLKNMTVPFLTNYRSNLMFLDMRR